MVILNVNNDEVVKFANQLEKLHKSAMPVAVRQTLNEVAFIARRESLSKFNRNFTIRQKTFAKSHLVVNKSPNTFSINQMFSETGIVQGKSKAGDNLKINETGGTLSNRTTPTYFARLGKKRKGKINPRNYKKAFANMPKGVVYKSPEYKLIKTQSRLLMVAKGGKWTTLYKTGTFDVKENPFLVPGAIVASQKVNEIFIKYAERQFLKY